LSKHNNFSSETSHRYALALYELGIEKKQLDEFVLNIVAFRNLFNSNSDLRNFIKNPTNSYENQKIVFEKILNLMNFNETIKSFFQILILKKRIFFLDKIVEEFLKLVSFKKGEISANLISSKKIDNKTVLDIEKEISENINKSIKLNYSFDESLLGGVILQIGSLMIDASLKNKLQKYKKLMIES